MMQRLLNTHHRRWRELYRLATWTAQLAFECESHPRTRLTLLADDARDLADTLAAMYLAVDRHGTLPSEEELRLFLADAVNLTRVYEDRVTRTWAVPA